MTASTVLARAAGPLGALIRTDRSRLRGRNSYELSSGANPLVLLHRVAFVTAGGAFDKGAEECLLAWAQQYRLGQDPVLIARAGARRERALAPARATGRHRRILVRPQWRLAVGLGNRANPYEIGLSLHGTYGWPVIPGSTLKGVTRAWATANGLAESDPVTFAAVVGTEHAGTVAFLDALPVGGPVTVTRDVVTPHVQPYYQADPAPPAEYHNPVPSEFLTISAGTFAIDLLALMSPHIHQAELLRQVSITADWCAAAVDDLGVGAKTGAGYGYLAQERQP